YSLKPSPFATSTTFSFFLPKSLYLSEIFMELSNIGVSLPVLKLGAGLAPNPLDGKELDLVSVLGKDPVLLSGCENETVENNRSNRNKVMRMTNPMVIIVYFSNKFAKFKYFSSFYTSKILYPKI